MMKKLLFCILAVALAAGLVAFNSPAEAKEVRFRMAWDQYPPEPPLDLKWIRIYMRTPDGQYDYTQPFHSEPQTFDENGSHPSITTYLTVNPTDGQISTYKFVARAEGSTPDRQSPDSVEVTWDIDLRALLAVSDLAAVYNDEAGSVDFTWTPADPDRTKKWRLYQSDSATGPWTEIDTMDWDGTTTPLTASKPITVAAGTAATYYFTVVAFGEHSVASPDSNVVSVTIDRRETPAVVNLRVLVEEATD
jgi:hypothetical protein